MTRSQILDLSIKIIGIYLFAKSITILKDIYILAGLYHNEYSDVPPLVVVSFYVAAIAIMVFVAYYLTFRSKQITSRIFKSAESELPVITLGFEKGLELALIIFGLNILIFKFPLFIQAINHMIWHFIDKYDQPYSFIDNGLVYIIFYLFGLVLILKPKTIARWISQYTDLDTE